MKVSSSYLSLHFGGKRLRMDEPAIKRVKSSVLIVMDSSLRDKTEQRGQEKRIPTRMALTPSCRNPIIGGEKEPKKVSAPIPKLGGGVPWDK